MTKSLLTCTLNRKTNKHNVNLQRQINNLEDDSHERQRLIQRLASMQEKEKEQKGLQDRVIVSCIALSHFLLQLVCDVGYSLTMVTHEKILYIFIHYTCIYVIKMIYLEYGPELRNQKKKLQQACF